ncbi:ccp1 [Scenedesmus sp. PABB004]|nr:ccp1 [Scenedesmus sp. PABB004]
MSGGGPAPPAAPAGQDTDVVEARLPRGAGVAVLYPGYIGDPGAALATLGGADALSAALADAPAVLKLHLRPEDPASHPLFGMRREAPGLVLRVARRRGDPGAAPRVTVAARLTAAYTFDGLADFQYVSAEAAPPGARDLSRLGAANQPGAAEPFGAPQPLLLVPPLFSRLDVPVGFAFADPPPAAEAEPAPSSRRRVISFYDPALPPELPVPDGAYAGEAAAAQLAALRALLAERPAWPVELLLERLPGASEESLAPALAALCYQFRTGPWKSMFLACGFDPRASLAGRPYQLLAVRLPPEWAKAVRAAKAAGRPMQQPPLSQLLRFSALPVAHTTLLPLADLAEADAGLAQLLEGAPQPAALSEAYGWLTYATMQRLQQAAAARFAALVAPRLAALQREAEQPTAQQPEQAGSEQQQQREPQREQQRADGGDAMQVDQPAAELQAAAPPSGRRRPPPAPREQPVVGQEPPPLDDALGLLGLGGEAAGPELQRWIEEEAAAAAAAAAARAAGGARPAASVLSDGDGASTDAGSDWGTSGGEEASEGDELGAAIRRALIAPCAARQALHWLDLSLGPPAATSSGGSSEPAAAAMAGPLSAAELDALRAEVADAPPVVLYHYPCPDGAFAALAAALAYRARGVAAVFVPHEVYRPLELDDLALDPRAVAFLLDYAGPDGLPAALCRRVARVVVLDHHKTAAGQLADASARPANLAVHLDMARSGAAIAAEFFRPALTPDQQRMFSMVEDADLWRWALPDSEAFHAGLGDARLDYNAAANPALFDQLAALRPDDVIAQGREVLARQEVLIAEALARAAPHQLGGAAGLTRGWGTCLGVGVAGEVAKWRSALGNRLAARSAELGLTPVGLVAYTEAEMPRKDSHIKVSLRSVGGWDTSRVAEAFGGGGHAAASSCILSLAELGAWAEQARAPSRTATAGEAICAARALVLLANPPLAAMALRSLVLRAGVHALRSGAVASPAAQQAARGFASASGGGSGGLIGGLAVLGAGLWAANEYGYIDLSGVKSQLPPLPMLEAKKDYGAVRKAIEDLLDADDYDDGSYGPVLVRLAWHASGTYDKASGTGGSNGATMRFAPESEHGANAGLAVARGLLEPVKAQYPWISYADLWTLAGAVAIEAMGGPAIPWSPGRVDKADGSACPPDGRLPDAAQGAGHVRDIFGRMGFDDREMVALVGAHTVGRCHTDRSGYSGPWTNAPITFSNLYFQELVNNKWRKKKWSGPLQYEDKSGALMMLPADMALLWDRKFKAYVDLYAKDEEAFFKDFAAAFGKLLALGVPAPSA